MTVNILFKNNKQITYTNITKVRTFEDSDGLFLDITYDKSLEPGDWTTCDSPNIGIPFNNIKLFEVLPDNEKNRW